MDNTITENQRRIDQHFRLQKFVGRSISLDLGQIGSSKLKVIEVKDGKVFLVHNSSKKKINLSMDSFEYLK